MTTKMYLIPFVWLLLYGFGITTVTVLPIPQWEIGDTYFYTIKGNGFSGNETCTIKDTTAFEGTLVYDILTKETIQYEYSNSTYTSINHNFRTMETLDLLASNRSINTSMYNMIYFYCSTPEIPASQYEAGTCQIHTKFYQEGDYKYYQEPKTTTTKRYIINGSSIQLLNIKMEHITTPTGVYDCWVVERETQVYISNGTYWNHAHDMFHIDRENYYAPLNATHTNVTYHINDNGTSSVGSVIQLRSVFTTYLVQGLGFPVKTVRRMYNITSSQWYVQYTRELTQLSCSLPDSSTSTSSSITVPSTQSNSFQTDDGNAYVDNPTSPRQTTFYQGFNVVILLIAVLVIRRTTKK